MASASAIIMRKGKRAMTNEKTNPAPKKRRTQAAKPKQNKLYRFNFGQYKGRTIEDVWRENESYISNFIIDKHMFGESDLI